MIHRVRLSVRDLSVAQPLLHDQKFDDLSCKTNPHAFMFRSINTIVITDTVICTPHVSNFDLVDAIFRW